MASSTTAKRRKGANDSSAPMHEFDSVLHTTESFSTNTMPLPPPATAWASSTSSSARSTCRTWPSSTSSRP
eukprot:8561433-Heterocapsa_arctica.AAC.1